MVLLVAILGFAGCGFDYYPTTLRSHDGQRVYTMVPHAQGGVFETTLTRDTGGRRLSVTLSGKGDSITLSPDGGLLAVALDSQHDGREVALIESNSLEVMKRISCKKHFSMVGHFPNGEAYVVDTVRWDRVALSRGSTMLATYFWKPSPQGYEPVIALWDTKSGALIRELHLPEEDKALNNVVHTQSIFAISFSENGTAICAAGGWFIKEDRVIQPDGFVRVWRVHDGQCLATFRTKGQSWLSDICVDDAADYVAGWYWEGRETGKRSVAVWRLSDGTQVAKEICSDAIRYIAWSAERDGFEVCTDLNKRQLIVPAPP